MIAAITSRAMHPMTSAANAIAVVPRLGHHRQEDENGRRRRA
jgi:hypothetical protein